MKKRERLGARAVRAGFASEEQVQEVLLRQLARQKEGKRHTPLGLLLAELGVLTSEQLVQLLEAEGNSGFRLSEDAIRLATRMLANSDDASLRVLFTGLGPGDGVTTIVSQVGLVLALVGQGPVVLVDTNAGSPRLGRLFNAPSAPGVTDVVAGRKSLDDVLFDTGVEGLSVLPQGGNAGTGGTRLLLEQSRHLFKELSDRFQVVLLDTPPILTHVEAALFARQVDSVILVGAAGRRRQSEFMEAVACLRGYRAKVEGVVLTREEGQHQDHSAHHSKFAGR